MDTPGIGPDEAITQKLKRYIPNAVSFIFVITVINAGGLQDDRVSISEIYSNGICVIRLFVTILCDTILL